MQGAFLKNLRLTKNEREDRLLLNFSKLRQQKYFLHTFVSETIYSNDSILIFFSFCDKYHKVYN